MVYGQLTHAAFIPGSFWVITQGHAGIPDGRRFLVVNAWGNGKHWLAWADGIIKPLSGERTLTLLHEEFFVREEATT